MDRDQIYKYLHLLGIILTFLSYGMLLYKDKIQKGKGLAIANGVGLFLILLGGGGMQAVLKVGMQPWVIAKMVLWVILGAVIVLIKRKPDQKILTAWVLISIGAIATYLGVFKNLLFF